MTVAPVAFGNVAVGDGVVWLYRGYYSETTHALQVFWSDQLHMLEAIA